MRSISLPLTILALASLLSLAACTSGITQSAEEIEQRYYLLSPDLPQGGDQTLDAMLKIKRVDSSPSLAGRGLIYLTHDKGVITDYYNLFHSTPVDLLSSSIARVMKEAGPFRHVADRSTDARPNYILEANLVTLHGDFETPSSPRAVVEMQFFLLHDTEFDYEIIMDLDLREEIPLADMSAPTLVRGYDQALTTMLQTLVEEVRQAVR